MSGRPLGITACCCLCATNQGRDRRQALGGISGPPVEQSPRYAVHAVEDLAV